MSAELIRASIFHTPRNPYRDPQALEYFEDGGLLIRDGRVAACGDYRDIEARVPDVPVRDLRGGYLLPGFIDTHVHFPQVRILGGLGRELLDWLEHVALPEEARMAHPAYASGTARRFLRALAMHGTTTALVFGSHFQHATATLFEEAEPSGLRLAIGQVLSDRLLRPELHRSPEDAYRESTDLIRRYHGRGRLLFAVTPRFAISASEAMLEVCQTLLAEHQGLRFQTHINESPQEVAAVRRLFPWAQDYLGVYEKFGLSRPGSIFAHNVHASDAELHRLAGSGSAVSHCPCSNALLGSGIFPMRRHLDAGVRCALGTDVGGGAGFGLMKEALQAYAMQRVARENLLLSPAHMLYLATRAGAEALQLEGETGDFGPGKSADFVWLRAPKDSLLEGALERTGTPEAILAALFTLGGTETIAEVRVGGELVRHDA